MQCRDVAVTITLVRLAPGRNRAAPSPEQEGVDVADGNREQKQIVVPPPTLPKNVIAVRTRAGELTDSSVSEVKRPTPKIEAKPCINNRSTSSVQYILHQVEFKVIQSFIQPVHEE